MSNYHLTLFISPDKHIYKQKQIMCQDCQLKLIVKNIIISIYCNVKALI